MWDASYAKTVSDFLLVVASNRGRIAPGFGDTVAQRYQNR